MFTPVILFVSHDIPTLPGVFPSRQVNSPAINSRRHPFPQLWPRSLSTPKEDKNNRREAFLRPPESAAPACSFPSVFDLGGRRRGERDLASGGTDLCSSSGDGLWPSDLSFLLVARPPRAADDPPGRRRRPGVRRWVPLFFFRSCPRWFLLSCLGRLPGVKLLRRGIFGIKGAGPALSAAEGASKRRPFFTSPDELLEEEYYYYDEQLPEKKRRLTAEQVHLLERSFEAENKLEPERKGELARKLGMQPRQVAVWFQNRRARWKNKQLEHDFDRLKSSYNTLLADHDSLLRENDRLRSQAISLSLSLSLSSIPR
ncbi:hypothetical protein B296_00019884 [Ensete ventricosum]|uniref:Homeobox-leucine zipper protein n=1 Tax=Ensete ventricosum TaxID=4639 RepID=A0A426ZH69_ENSVE|nr:hypothetical protein B296_00019884 [Ensete ventricosum]